MPTTPNLFDRIRQALQDTWTAQAVAQLIGEVETALSAARTRTDEAEAIARDPFTDEAAAKAARTEADSNRIAAERLDAAHARLVERRLSLGTAEEQTRRAAQYNAAMAERDALADAIRTRYPDLVTELVAMAQGINASNAAVDAANVNRPDGKEPLAYAEWIAREIAPGNHSHPRIETALKLPAAKDDNSLAWPARNFMGNYAY